MEYKIKMILGNRGTGKTGTFIRHILTDYVAINKGKFTAGVFDLENNYNYNTFECLSDPSYPESRKKLLRSFVKMPIPIVAASRFPALKQGIVRVLPGAHQNAGEFTKQVFREIVYNRSIHKCLVVIEDTARFMPDNNGLDSSLRDLIINCKQRAMEIVLIFHFWSDVPPKLLKWIDELYLHKCDESVITRKSALSEVKVAKIIEAEARLRKKPGKYLMEKIQLN